MNTGKTILVIPDSHAKPGVSNERFDWLGQLILDLRPDVVVELGDFADMPSLSSYDQGRREFEGRRLKEDIESAQDARRRLTQPLRLRQSRQKKNKDKIYRPRLIALGGNHEQRIDRLMSSTPELYGLYSQDVSNAAAWGWEFHPFLEPVEVCGIMFCHYFTSGVMGRPIGGENPATALINKVHRSAVQGHSHLLDFSRRYTQTGERINGLIAGCFFEHEETYAGPANKMWSRGVAILRNAKDGDFDLEWISFDQIKETYSKE